MADSRGDLIWFFANGHRVNPAPSTGMPENGLRGSGNSGTKGVFRDFDPDLVSMVRWGRISRALHAVGDTHRRVLELAYGDVGAALTECSLRPGDRWKAVAPMAEAITDHVPTKGRRQLEKLRGKRPLDERIRDTSCGPVAVHRVQHLLSQTAPNEQERAIIAQVREQSTARLRAAEEAFAAVWVGPSRAEVAEAREARCG